MLLSKASYAESRVVSIVAQGVSSVAGCARRRALPPTTAHAVSRGLRSTSHSGRSSGARPSQPQVFNARELSTTASPTTTRTSLRHRDSLASLQSRLWRTSAGDTVALAVYHITSSNGSSVAESWSRVRQQCPQLSTPSMANVSVLSTALALQAPTEMGTVHRPPKRRHETRATLRPPPPLAFFPRSTLAAWEWHVTRHSVGLWQSDARGMSTTVRTCSRSPSRSMPIALPSMSSRLESTSAILGEYMLKGWLLTDLHCDECRVTPLMREPAFVAAREGRPPIQFCALCDGGPEGREEALAAASAVHAGQGGFAPAGLPEESPSIDEYVDPLDFDAPITPPSETEDPLATPRRAPATTAQEPPASPPMAHAASARADPDAAAEAISALLLRGYSLLGTGCPDPGCVGIPLVGFPRRKDGTRDPRRECVSCGKRWVNERDLADSGLKVQDQAAASGFASKSPAQPTPTRPSTTSRPSPKAPASAPAPAQSKRPATSEPESPRTKARRELYETGEAIMSQRAAAKAAEGDKFADAIAAETAKLAASTASASSSTAVTAPLTEEPSPAQPASSSTAPTVAQWVDQFNAASSQPFVASNHRPDTPDGKLRVVVISTGSVASIKIPLIVAELRRDPRVEVQVVATAASLHFYDAASVEKDNKGVRVWTDKDEWSDWRKVGDPILHIELRRWADLVVVAPCSADMLAKIVAGVCDNLPLSLLRALAGTPVVLCPAMNTHMYEHPLTARHTAFVEDVLGYHVLGPQNAGQLACGDVGAGKMTDWRDIVAAINSYAAVFRSRPERASSALAAILGNEPQVKTTVPAVTVTERPRSARSARSVARSRAAPEARSTKAVTTRTGQTTVRSMSTAVVPSAKSLVSIAAAPFRLLLIPLLFLLHTFFTFSSIVLRVVQAQPSPPLELAKAPPRHLALILVPGRTPAAAQRYVESVQRAVQWAADWGVQAISIWDGQGLGIAHHATVTDSLVNLPPSPPSSSPASPPQSLPQSSSASLASDPGHLGDETVISSVYVHTPSGSRHVELYFLPPSASDVVATVTRQYAQSHTPADEITQSALDTAILHALGLTSEPDLVVVHHLSPPGFWRGLLPRPAPELWGFPAWLLRITEIYAHPPTLPLYIPRVGTLLHNSHLPILRKLGAAFPPQADGVLSEQEWEGAQTAWERVEQRRGK